MKLLSIDCGTVHTGISLCEEKDDKFIVHGLWCIGIADGWDTPDNKRSNTTLRAYTIQLLKFKELIVEKFGSDMIVLIEQQPQLNRKSCMIHDTVAVIFHEFEQYNIHPACKNKLELDTPDGTLSIATCKGAKPQKVLTQRITEYMIATTGNPVIREQYNSMKKKDDVADALCQALFFARLQKVNSAAKQQAASSGQ